MPPDVPDSWLDDTILFPGATLNHSGVRATHQWGELIASGHLAVASGPRVTPAVLARVASAWAGRLAHARTLVAAVTPAFFDHGGANSRDALLAAVELSRDLPSLSFRLRGRGWLAYGAGLLRERGLHFSRAELALRVVRSLTIRKILSAALGSDLDAELALGEAGRWTEGIVSQRLWLAIEARSVSARISVDRERTEQAQAVADLELAYRQEIRGRRGRLTFAATARAQTQLPAERLPAVTASVRFGFGRVRLELGAHELGSEAPSFEAELRVTL